MPTLIEMRDAANAALAHVRELEAADEVNGEALDAAIAKATNLFSEVSTYEARSAKVRELESLAKAPAQRQTPAIMPHNDPTNTRNGKHEFDVWKALREGYAQKRGEGQLTGVEAETIAEMRQLRPNSGGVLIPFDAKIQTRALDLSTGAGAVGQQIMLPIIDVLRNRLVLAQLGVRLIAAPGPFKLPKASAATAYWGTAAPTLSTPGLAGTAFVPYTVGARTKIDRGMLKYSSIDAQAYTIDQLINVTAQAIQTAALHGTGPGDLQPLGLFGYTGSDVNVLALGTNGLALTRAHLLSLIAGSDAANASDATQAFVTSSKVIGKLEATVLESGYPKYLYDSATKTIINRPVAMTNSVKDNLTKGTSTGVCSAIAFGAWEEMAISLFGGGFEVYIDDVSGQDGSVSVSVLNDVDVQLMHGKAFSIAVDVLTA